MTDLQNKEFEILKEFIEICDKLGLSYFLVCGSALGASKYHGFIPWDDDIDVALKRADYERFCQEAPAYLSPRFFLQTYKTDLNYPHVFAKLRNSETTYIEKSVSHIRMNHGIYIDIFPLDGYPKGKIDIIKLTLKKKLYDIKMASVFSQESANKKVRIISGILRKFGFQNRYQRAVANMDKFFAGFPIDDSVYWCNYGNWQGKTEYASPCQYGEGAWEDFEGIKVRIPENFDVYLTQKYGDWRADLPESEQVGHHFAVMIDTKHSYQMIVSNLQQGQNINDKH